jgi:hypothetical protein
MAWRTAKPSWGLGGFLEAFDDENFIALPSGYD